MMEKYCDSIHEFIRNSNDSYNYRCYLWTEKLGVITTDLNSFYLPMNPNPMDYVDLMDWVDKSFNNLSKTRKVLIKYHPIYVRFFQVGGFDEGGIIPNLMIIKLNPHKLALGYYEII